MKYRCLGRTGLEVSVVGIGTWQFGGEWAKEFTVAEVRRILDAGADAGINLIDTAECYGASESLIGDAIRGSRERWLIATKFGHRYEGVPTRVDCWSPQEILEQLETSLRSLQTDYVDLYQFHSGTDEAFDQPELWEALRREQAAGKIRFLGISLKDNDNLHQTERATDVGADAIQVVYNRLDRRAETRVLRSCMEQDLGVLARVPLERGFLSGKYFPGATFVPEDIRSTYDREAVERNLELVAEIRGNEVPEGVDIAQWALAWCLSNPAVTAVLPGCKTVEQVQANAAAAAFVSDPTRHGPALGGERA